jgi:nucleoside-diphosphate-sugar epimerase
MCSGRTGCVNRGPFVTGVNSGLGRYVYEKIGRFAFTRDTTPEELEIIKNSKIDLIIHCAFGHMEDNVALTKKLVSFPHKKFIFISSIDVYPKDGNKHREGELIGADSAKEEYGVTKLMCEDIVKKHCKDYLIIRPSALLGKYSRRNSLIKIIEDKKCSLSLSGKSRFNYILHSDALDFIKFAAQKNVQGIFNLTSSTNITLSQIADTLGKKVKFGNFLYDAGDIDNGKACSIFPSFGKTSKEVITQFIKENYA